MYTSMDQRLAKHIPCTVKYSQPLIFIFHESTHYRGGRNTCQKSQCPPPSSYWVSTRD
jgi:hypothetical protein